eukprot:TRINITY_DN8453_c0_g2_i9.p1 TRINITY_DN8453_c0_g2~~TRINITY_DN8453_c0_g2_i9.p1  ORF type:complete len:384 (+),score=63.34 TRINITY_DN8453_c0_g2_i9:72-1154(+)
MGLKRQCSACWNSLSRPVLRAADSDEDRQQKVFLMPIYCAIVLLCVVLLMAGSFRTVTRMSHVQYLLTIVSNSLTVVLMRFCSGGRLRLLIGLSLVANVLGTIIRDWANASVAELRLWGLAIVLIDVALVCNVHKQVVSLILFILVAWLLIERIESVYVFGLYDSSYWGPGNQLVDLCDCSDPPCALSARVAFAHYVALLFIFFSDFYLTRGFAEGMRQQFAMVTASVSVCTSVATMLSRYEVSAARELVDGVQGAALPPEMRVAFGVLLRNLDSYRPYLPQSCLRTDERGDKQVSDTDDDSRPPPVQDAETRQDSLAMESARGSYASSHSLGACSAASVTLASGVWVGRHLLGGFSLSR